MAIVKPHGNIPKTLYFNVFQLPEAKSAVGFSPKILDQAIDNFVDFGCPVLYISEKGIFSSIPNSFQGLGKDSRLRFRLKSEYAKTKPKLHQDAQEEKGMDGSKKNMRVR